jgi:hypothetical protein
MIAASCWFGGLWADALGEEGEMRSKGVEGRCHELEQKVWGTEDKSHYEELRALGKDAAADVIAKVDEIAKNDVVDGPRRDALVKLATAFVEAEREFVMAHRAGDRVKRDLDHEPEKLSSDEVDAVISLRAHAKVEKLYKLDAGNLSHEANALAVLCALDRLEVARGLPKHLKFYAVADIFDLLFGVPLPDVPEDVSKKLVPGTWLKFLAATAAEAGHPVSDKVTAPRERDALAWAGMLLGFSDKLKVDVDGIEPATDLGKVVTVVEHRLETGFTAQKAAEATLQKPAVAPAKK